MNEEKKSNEIEIENNNENNENKENENNNENKENENNNENNNKNNNNNENNENNNNKNNNNENKNNNNENNNNNNNNIENSSKFYSTSNLPFTEIRFNIQFLIEKLYKHKTKKFQKFLIIGPPNNLRWLMYHTIAKTNYEIIEKNLNLNFTQIYKFLLNKYKKNKKIKNYKIKNKK